MMRRAAVWLESCRLWLLPLSLPQAMMWSEVTGSGGVWMVIVHSALVLLYFLSLDQVFLVENLDPPFGLRRDRYRHDARTAEVARSALMILIGIVSFIALFVEIWLGVVAAVVAILIVLRVRSANGPDARRRFMLAELVVPAGIILLPALFIGSWEWGTQLESTRGQRLATTAAEGGDGVMGADIVGSAIALALMIGAFVLLCMLRDEAVDRASQLRTTVIWLGREASTLYALILIGVALALIVFGVGADWWGSTGWLVGAISAVAALAVVWSLADRSEGRAAGVWILASVLASIMMARGVMISAADAGLPAEGATESATQLENESANPVDQSGTSTPNDN
jgi:1,4-dihydroxy-2-naphthoate octaprenyltransferase